MDFEERPPPGSDFAQRVAYAIYAVCALFTIAFALLLVLFVTYIIMIGG